MSANPEKIWYTRCPAATPLGLALRNGWVQDAYQQLGIPTESLFEHADPEIRRSHFDHHLPFSIRQGGNIPPLWTRAKGAETRLIALSWADEFQAIITLPESGISRARDLNGRRYGAPKVVSASPSVDVLRALAIKGLVSARELEGLDTAGVEIIDLAITADVPSLGNFSTGPYQAYRHEVLALLTGKVDAVFVKGPEGVAVANLIGARIVSEFGYHPDARIRVNGGTPRPLTIDARFADERPDLVDVLLAEVVRAGDWAESHPAETLAILAREASSSEVATRASQGAEFNRSLAIDLDPRKLQALEHYKNFLREWGFIANDFSFADWVDYRPLERANHRLAAE